MDNDDIDLEMQPATGAFPAVTARVAAADLRDAIDEAKRQRALLDRWAYASSFIIAGACFVTLGIVVADAFGWTR